MSVDIFTAITHATRLINTLIEASDEVGKFRTLVATAVAEGRNLTEEERDMLFAEAQNAIDAARDN